MTMGSAAGQAPHAHGRGGVVVTWRMVPDLKQEAGSPAALHAAPPRPRMRHALAPSVPEPARPGAAAQRLPADLSSSDVRDALQAGKRTLIVPVGGTEQSGPHLALGKHNVRAQVLAGRIAAELGNALVAPVVAYVPEGPHPPRPPSTCAMPARCPFPTAPSAACSTAPRARPRSTVSPTSSSSATTAATRPACRPWPPLNRDWKAGPARAHHIAAYYDAAQAPFAKLLRARFPSDAQIGSHAGAADTALMLAVDPSKVWPDKAMAQAAGVSGDPRRASAELGQLGVDLIVRQSVAAIRQATAAPR